MLKVEAPKHEEFYMKRIFLFLLLAGFYGLAAIDSYAQKSVKFELQESQARVLDVNPSTYVKPVIAELSVDTSKGRLRDKWTLNADELAARVIKNDDKATLQNLRTYAVYKSSEKANCDVVIAATFDIRITDDGASIIVTGYPANFTNWKTGTVADYEWIKNEPGQINLTSTSVEGSDKK